MLNLFLALLQGVSAAPQDFDRLAILAAQARDANRFEEAIALYRKATSLRPKWAEGWWRLGTLLYDRDSYAEAAQAFQTATALNPQVGNAWVMLGLSEVKLGRSEAALKHIQKGRRLGVSDDPRLRRVMLYNEGMLLLEKGDFGQAQAGLDSLCREGVSSPELIMGLGLSVLGIRPSTLPPDDASTLEIIRRAGWAEHYAAQRSQLSEALREYERFAADFPKLHNVQFAYGRFLLANHYDDKAVEAFQRELENSPSHLLARLGIAGIKSRTDPAGGLPYAEQAVKLYPKVAEGHYLLGVLLLDTGDTVRAIAELETAQRSEPNGARIYFALGRAYARANRKEDAARARAAFTRLNEQTQGARAASRNPTEREKRP